MTPEEKEINERFGEQINNDWHEACLISKDNWDFESFKIGWLIGREKSNGNK